MANILLNTHAKCLESTWCIKVSKIQKNSRY